MCQNRHHQRGAIGLVMVVLLMMLALSILISKTGDLIVGVGKRVTASNDTLDKIRKTLISFTATYQNLPCPADPTGATNPGWPNGSTTLTLGVATCTYHTGVVPWNALGLTQSQVTDEWGRLISYRVYDGPFGLTQNTGASALPCSNNLLPASTVAPTANGLCDITFIPSRRTLHSSTSPNFIASSTPAYDKGLWVNDFGTTIKNVAFVLVSHGPSGLGGYMPNGSRMPMPQAGALDYPNTQIQAPPLSFTRLAVSDPSIATGATGHYDDIVTYLTIADLLRLSSLDSRGWP